MKNQILHKAIFETILAESDRYGIEIKPEPVGKGVFDGFEIILSNPGSEVCTIGHLLLFSISKEELVKYFFPDVPRKFIRMMFYNDAANNIESLFQNGTRPFYGEPQRVSDVKCSKSRLFTILYAEGENPDGIFFGAVPSDRHRIFCTRFILEDEIFRAECEVGVKISPGEEIHVTTLLLYSGKQLRICLEEFSSLFGMPRKCPDLGRNAGWSTWDYYLWQVSESDVIENMNEIRNNRDLRERIKYLVIDDGWQHAYGEWEANYKFPRGMACTASEIKDAGFSPGLWIGPFLQTRQGQIESKHPEMILKDRYTGCPVIADHPDLFILDPTHPGTESFLRETFEKIRSWGYEYVKIDYLFFIFDIVSNRNGRLFDESRTPLEALRHGIEIIREALGDNIVLVGCGGFIPEVGTGLFDSCRASFDIGPYWSNILLISRDLVLKSFFARRTWENDCDFLIVRGKETSDENKINSYENLNFFSPERSFEPFAFRKGSIWQTVGEIRVWATMLIIAGGSLVLADRLKMLNDQAFAIIDKVLKYSSGKPGYPMDLFQPGLPQVWCKEEVDGHRFIAIFNWSDEILDFRVEKALKYLGADHVVEIWSGKKVSAGDDSLRIPPRDVFLFHC